MKPTIEQFMDVVRAWTELIPFFPKEILAQQIVCEELERFVSTKEQLDWLGSMVCRVFRAWSPEQGNLPNIRGLFCTRFKPADGLETLCTAPGFTPEAMEAAGRASEIAANDARFKQYQRQALEAPKGEIEESRKLLESVGQAVKVKKLA